MLTMTDKETILTLSKKYNVKKVFLFGSSIDPMAESNDIDLAVEGLKDSVFFKYYSELLFNLSKPFDLVDITKKSRFNDFISRESIVIYE